MSLVGLLAVALLVIGAIGALRVAVWLSFRWLGHPDPDPFEDPFGSC